MKRLFVIGTVLVLLLGATFLPDIVSADVQVGINIGVPPPLVFSSPPELVVIPSGPHYVYMVPGMAGLYFHGGHWYRFHGGHWYRAVAYSGPWTFIEIALVPAPILAVPPDYILYMPPGYHRIHYHEFHTHWRDWDRTRYWHNKKWFKEHSKHHWAGKEFHNPPPGHPAHQRSKSVAGPHDKSGKPMHQSKVGGGPKHKKGEGGPHDKRGIDR